MFDPFADLAIGLCLRQALEIIFRGKVIAFLERPAKKIVPGAEPFRSAESLH
jgi:hypothetical protein